MIESVGLVCSDEFQACFCEKIGNVEAFFATLIFDQNTLRILRVLWMRYTPHSRG